MINRLIEWVIKHTVKNCVYVSGPMTGYKDLNKPEFHKTALKLRKKGYRVVDPAEFGDGIWKFC